MRNAIALALLAALPGASRAQDVQAESAALDSVAALHRAAITLRKAHNDSVARARQTLDTLRATPLVILVAPADRALAEATARLALDSIRPLGDALLEKLGDVRFVLRRVPPPRWASPDERPITIAIIDDAGVEGAYYWEMQARYPHLASYVADHVRLRAARLFPASLTAWATAHAPNPFVRLDSVGAFEWSQLRLDLASSASVVARRCFAGELRECRYVLALDSADAPLRQLFDAAGRRVIVHRSADHLRRQDERATERCLAGNDQSCLSLLERALPDVAIAATGHRIALVQLALQRGGPDARMRLLAGTGSVEQQLATIAGLPTDSLIAEWHARLRTSRVASDNMSGGMAFASIGWLGLLGFLALRNSRWR